MSTNVKFFEPNDVLPVSPLDVPCPLCKAERGQDCTTISRTITSAHGARIKAAALIEKTPKAAVKR